jgi:hypothetical protein
MSGGKGKSHGGKAGPKAQDGSKTQVSHSAKAGLQVRSCSLFLFLFLFLFSFFALRPRSRCRSLAPPPTNMVFLSSACARRRLFFNTTARQTGYGLPFSWLRRREGTTHEWSFEGRCAPRDYKLQTRNFGLSFLWLLLLDACYFPVSKTHMRHETNDKSR